MNVAYWRIEEEEEEEERLYLHRGMFFEKSFWKISTIKSCTFSDTLFLFSGIHPFESPSSPPFPPLFPLVLNAPGWRHVGQESHAAEAVSLTARQSASPCPANSYISLACAEAQVQLWQARVCDKHLAGSYLGGQLRV